MIEKCPTGWDRMDGTEEYDGTGWKDGKKEQDELGASRKGTEGTKPKTTKQLIVRKCQE